tara:strand:- start:214 stop:330 length:117 start_codon:yes stop_codon:yes gene_type:complete
MKSNKDIFIKAQGRAAMMGFIFMCASYAISGHIVPGLV